MPLRNDQMYAKLMALQNAAGLPLLSPAPQNAQVAILPDPQVTPGKFKPLTTGGQNAYRAHPQTIRAMRKDLFVGGDDFVDLEDWSSCRDCKNRWDQQFWWCCPQCLAPLIPEEKQS